MNGTAGAAALGKRKTAHPTNADRPSKLQRSLSGGTAGVAVDDDVIEDDAMLDGEEASGGEEEDSVGSLVSGDDGFADGDAISGNGNGNGHGRTERHSHGHQQQQASLPPAVPPAVVLASGAAESAEWQETIQRVVCNVVSIRFCMTCSFDTEPALTSEATGFVVDAERGCVVLLSSSWLPSFSPLLFTTTRWLIDPLCFADTS